MFLAKPKIKLRYKSDVYFKTRNISHDPHPISTRLQQDLKPISKEGKNTIGQKHNSYSEEKNSVFREFILE